MTLWKMQTEMTSSSEALLYLNAQPIRVLSEVSPRQSFCHLKTRMPMGKRYPGVLLLRLCIYREETAVDVPQKYTTRVTAERH